MLDLPNKKYDVIVIDPPWNIKKLTHKKRPNQVNMDYKTMSLETIKELNIQKLAKNSAWIFLWTTQKYLFDAKDVLINWGFK